MSDLLLENNDLKFTNGELTLISGGEEIKQRISERLQLFKGEWFLDTTVGVPYFQSILKKNPVREEVEAFLVQAIAETPGVEEITQFEASFGTDRKATVNFRVRANNELLELEIEI